MSTPLTPHLANKVRSLGKNPENYWLAVCASCAKIHQKTILAIVIGPNWACDGKPAGLKELQKRFGLEYKKASGTWWCAVCNGLEDKKDYYASVPPLQLAIWPGRDDPRPEHIQRAKWEETLNWVLEQNADGSPGGAAEAAAEAAGSAAAPAEVEVIYTMADVFGAISNLEENLLDQVNTTYIIFISMRLTPLPYITPPSFFVNAHVLLKGLS